MLARMPYVVKRRELLFWQPTKEMRAKGFLAKSLGPDGPEARAEASKLYHAWLKAKAEGPKITSYPAGSFGAYWDRFRTTEKWRAKKPRTHEDYERAWKHIDAFDGRRLTNKAVSAITTEDCEAFNAHLARTLSPSERHRAIKWLKVLLDDAMVRLRLPMQSPAAALANPQPGGRSAIWLGAEIPLLVKAATANGYHGMAVSIAIAWDTLFSPVDVRTLRRSEMAQDGHGWYLERSRGKTGKAAYGALSGATAAMLLAEIAKLPGDAPFDVQIIRQRNGEAYRSKDTFGDDFRAVRKLAFGPNETRQFLDIRRSGNVEADAAGADKATMGELLANGLADNKFLDETYTPPTVAKAREVATQRLKGRRKLAGEITRQRSNSAGRGPGNIG